MPTEKALPNDHPLMLAWSAHTKTDEFENSKRWAATHEHRDGSLWALFLAGYRAGTDRAGNLFESVNPASDDERGTNTPGAGAMGAVIEYRDLIRSGSV